MAVDSAPSQPEPEPVLDLEPEPEPETEAEPGLERETETAPEQEPEPAPEPQPEAEPEPEPELEPEPEPELEPEPEPALDLEPEPAPATAEVMPSATPPLPPWPARDLCSLPAPLAFAGREQELAELDRLLAAPQSRLELRGEPGSGRSSLALAWAASRRETLAGGAVWLDGRGDLRSQVLALLGWLQRRQPQLALPCDQPPEALLAELWWHWPHSAGPDDPVLLVLDDLPDDDAGRRLEQQLCADLPPRVRRLVIRAAGAGDLTLARASLADPTPPAQRLERLWQHWSGAERSLALRLAALAPAPLPAALLQALGDGEASEGLQRQGLLQPDGEGALRLAPALADALKDRIDAAGESAEREKLAVARALLALLERSAAGLEVRSVALEQAPLLPHGAAALLNAGALLGPEERLRLAVALGRLWDACRCGGEADEGQRTLLRRCLDLCRSGLGEHHPDTATARLNLAAAVAAQEPARALELVERAHATRLDSLGAGHPLSGRSAAVLGRLLAANGEGARAASLLEEALACLQAEGHGEEDICSLLLDDLALLQLAQGYRARAEALLQQALASRLQRFGAGHPAVATTAERLADLLEQQNRPAQAEPLRQQALSARRGCLGTGHPATLAAQRRLAELALRNGAPERAEAILREAERTVAAFHGAGHPEMGRTLDGLANLLWTTGRLEDAVDTYRRALNLLESSLGSDHADTAAVLNNLGFVCDALGREEEARRLLERAVAIRQRSLGPDALETASSLNNLAAHHAQRGEPGLALPLYQRVLEIIEARLGADDPACATVRANLEDCISPLRRDNLGRGG